MENLTVRFLPLLLLPLSLGLTTALWAAQPEPGTRQQIQVYKSVQDDGVVLYSDTMPMDSSYETLVFDVCYACDVNSKVDWQHTGLFVSEFHETIQAAAKTYRVEPALIRALIHAESAFNPWAVSRKGAKGLTQLMPGTARELGVTDPLNVQQNIFGGTEYLSRLLEQFNGDITLATAAYNAGPTAVTRHKGVPPYAETRTYVQRVQLLYQRYKQVLTAQQG